MKTMRLDMNMSISIRRRATISTSTKVAWIQKPDGLKLADLNTIGLFHKVLHLRKRSLQMIRIPKTRSPECHLSENFRSILSPVIKQKKKEKLARGIGKKAWSQTSCTICCRSSLGRIIPWFKRIRISKLILHKTISTRRMQLHKKSNACHLRAENLSMEPERPV